MTKRKILYLILLILVTFFTVAGLINRSNTTLSNEETDFSVNDTSTITKIFISDKDNHNVLLEKKDSIGWVLNEEYPALTTSVDLLLKTLKNITVKSPVSKISHDNVVTRLSSIGRKVEIYQTVYRIDLWGMQLFPHEKLTKTFYVGDNTQDLMGTYMLIEDAERPYIVYIPGFNGFLHTRFSPLEKDWRSHVIFSHKVGQIKSLDFINNDEKETSFSIKNQGDRQYALLNKDGKGYSNFDTLKVLDYLTRYNDIRYEAMLSEIDTDFKDSVLASPPFFEIVLTDMANESIHLKAFRKEAGEDILDLEGNVILWNRDRLYAEITFGNEPIFTLIQYYVFSPLIKSIDYFNKNYVEEKGPNVGIIELDN
jgi:Domain of unknown function (DUF4340)